MNEKSLNDSRDQKLDQILAAIQIIDSRIEQVETKVDLRLRETRPIWDGVHAQLTELRESVLAEGQSRQAQLSEFKGQISELKESVQAQIAEVKESQQSLRAEMGKSFRLLDRRMEMYAEMVARVHAYERDLEERVDELAKRLA